MKDGSRRPQGFRYEEVARKGRPVHARTDPFSLRHPPMPLSRRAKIFSPFDALRGFSDAVASREVLYVPRKQLNEEQCADLDRKIARLRKLTANTRICREHPTYVRVRHFVICSDPGSEAYGQLGQYEDTAGICLGVDPHSRTVTVGEQTISADDIIALAIAEEAD